MTMSSYRTFGIRFGATFISPPVDGDGAGHGGLAKPAYLFKKTEPQNPYTRFPAYETNSFRLRDGIRSRMPDTMPVIEVE